MKQNKLVAPLRSLVAEHESKQAKQESEGLKQQLAQTVEALHRTRNVKPVQFTPTATRKLRGDVVRVIIPDTHGAKVHKGALESVLADIKALHPDEIILMGDHVDCGGFLALHHVMGYVAETEYSYEQDIAAANAMLNALQAAAPTAKIEYIEGNHERRVETWCITQTLRHAKDSDFLRKSFAPEFKLGLAERGIPYYRQGEFYDGLAVPGVIKRGSIFFFHGFNASTHATRATQAKVAGNCVFAHTHRQQADLSRPMGTGVIGSWNPGCLCEIQPLWQHTRPTDWTHGYAVQLVSHTGSFLHLNIPIIEGASLLTALLSRTS